MSSCGGTTGGFGAGCGVGCGGVGCGVGCGGAGCGTGCGLGIITGCCGDGIILGANVPPYNGDTIVGFCGVCNNRVIVSFLVSISVDNATISAIEFIFSILEGDFPNSAGNLIPFCFAKFFNSVNFSKSVFNCSIASAFFLPVLLDFFFFFLIGVGGNTILIV